MARNVAEVAEQPRAERHEARTLEPDQVTRVLEALRDSPYRSVLYTSLYTGMRRSEVCGLRWRDVDVHLATISVVQTMHELPGGGIIFSEPKSKRGRRLISMPPSLAIPLREHYQAQKDTRELLGTPFNIDTLVFSWPDGRPMRPTTLTHTWGKIARRLGLAGVRLHDLRHTHASLMLRQNIHPKIVQERLGHANIGITLDTYSHIAPGLQEAAALRFDNSVEQPPGKAEISKRLAEQEEETAQTSL